MKHVHRQKGSPGFLLLVLSVLVSCSDAELSSDQAAGLSSEQASEVSRWYSELQRTEGAEVFAENCAVCHGERAEGLAGDWRERLDDGSFPPPPLDGSAHAWHHPLSLLTQVINNGGAAFGGKMPAFDTVLDEEQKLAVIAYFQDFWTDDIYSQWILMGGTN